MEPIKLSFGVLMVCLNRAILQVQDPRKASNGSNYTLKDAVLGAFSRFFMQGESFLEHQRQMESRHGKSNAQSLFGIIDGIVATALSQMFTEVYRALRRDELKFLGGLLIALDGTQYFTSHKIHCKKCSSRTHKDEIVTYYGAILPVIFVHVESQIIFLAPEFITSQDGHEKQDCEVAAATRWIAADSAGFIEEKITFLGDSLYSRQPMYKNIIKSEMDFIFTCLPTSHKALYDWLEYLDNIGEIKTLEIEGWNKSSKEIYKYRYINKIPIKDSQSAIEVNWRELIVTQKSNAKTLYENIFITSYELIKSSVIPVIEAGRWKTENENHSVLKTKVFYLKHNFGCGEEHLAACLLILNLLAFLSYTVLYLVDHACQKICQKHDTHKEFFQDIVRLTKYLLFEDWQSLIDFMLGGSALKQVTNSS